jgi:hypothetical protein
MIPTRFHAAVRRYATAGEALSERLAEGLAADPRCPVTRYLLGCQAFDQDRPATGTRHLMIAYHAEPDLQSAALLVFTGLVWGDEPDAPLLTVLERTYELFRRPPFDETPTERLLLDAFPPGPALRAALPEALCRFSRLPLASLRGQLATARTA